MASCPPHVFGFLAAPAQTLDDKITSIQRALDDLRVVD